MASSRQVLRQRNWSEAELKASRLRYYAPRKQLVMARVLNAAVDVQTTIEILEARKGDVMVYDPGDGTARAKLENYEHWPVNRDLFRKTYKVWDDRHWHPTKAEAHLLALGCLPYYKYRGVWAMRLTQPVYIQSLESPEPVEVPPGRWLVIGAEGEPYHMNDAKFRERYIVEDDVD
jgi:hypothetical protein